MIWQRLIALGLELLAVVGYFLLWNSPGRELLRTRDALLRQKTWHVHTVSPKLIVTASQ